MFCKKWCIYYICSINIKTIITRLQMTRILMNTKILFASILLLCSSCARKEESMKNIESMASQELKNTIQAALEKGRKQQAIMHLEHFVTHYSDDPEISDYKLMLADLHFKSNRYVPSFELYNHFKDLYPSDPRVEYASYYALLSKYYQTLSRDCDATHTQDTLALCKNYLKNRGFEEFRNDVQDIKRTCKTRLFNKNIHIVNSYLHRGKIKSAQTRLSNVREEYGKNKGMMPQILYLEGKIARRENNKDELVQKVAELVKNYPDSPYTHMAHGLIKDELKHVHVT